MEIKARFYSNSQNLMLHAPAVSRTVLQNGIPVVETTNPASIEFKEHIFDAFSDEEVEILRNHSASKILFSEVPLPAVIEKANQAFDIIGNTMDVEGSKSNIEVPNVKSRNDALNYFVTEKKVDASDLKKLKSVQEVKQYALDTFNIVFPEWE